MSINGTMRSRHYVLAVSLLLLLIEASAPALAQHGGGGHSGGGGHGGGGGHAAGAAHFAGAGGASHFASGAHYAAGAHPAAGAHYGGTHYAFAGGAGGLGYGGAGYHGSGYAARGGYAFPGGGYGRGYSTGAYWGGGYWRGGYWPRAYYGVGFSWFLPVLPLAYATYWYGGVPYYYANDVYYTWNPDYDGYTATDPPPASDSAPAAAAAAVPPQGGGGMPQGVAPSQGDVSQVFMYPKNGQTEQQQSTDKQECQRWASDQVGLGSNGPDYRRAFIACVQGRGYSAN